MVGSDDQGIGTRDLPINLCDDIPSFMEGFARVAELVTSDETCRQASRKRYAAYRDQGHELNTHKL
jgi:DNA polymerase-3 subunit chi